ncbi:hypothetical protein GGS23DRAFT_599518 [Durotheca rogersii]|uniref:uncharacterized protein n=1 Tax=Durotheca rogersii TaxID=419775 RepID=UPI00221F1F94|nr:uncharacterized protein GGS23DRAFT_599518 [Durotheca rogersii]KAI5860418.1 hypothetical protein GGS23DRAFT_599518 [Durotheca rogersii]
MDNQTQQSPAQGTVTPERATANTSENTVVETTTVGTTAVETTTINPSTHVGHSVGHAPRLAHSIRTYVEDVGAGNAPINALMQHGDTEARNSARRDRVQREVDEAMLKLSQSGQTFVLCQSDAVNLLSPAPL